MPMPIFVKSKKKIPILILVARKQSSSVAVTKQAIVILHLHIPLLLAQPLNFTMAYYVRSSFAKAFSSNPRDIIFNTLPLKRWTGTYKKWNKFLERKS